MPKHCIECKATGGFLKDTTFVLFRNGDLCPDCAEKLIKKIDSEVMVTSTENLQGYKIIEYVGFEGAESVVGTGLFAEMTGGTNDYFEKDLNLTEKNMNKARKAIILKLKRIAYEKECNAIIGLNLHYTEISSHRMGIAANGTIVRIEKTEF